MCGAGDLASAFVAVVEHGSEVVAVSYEFRAAGADGSEVFVGRVGDQVLEAAGAAVGDLACDLLGRTLEAECGHLGLAMARDVVQVEPLASAEPEAVISAIAAT